MAEAEEGNTHNPDLKVRVMKKAYWALAMNTNKKSSTMC